MVLRQRTAPSSRPQATGRLLPGALGAFVERWGARAAIALMLAGCPEANDDDSADVVDDDDSAGSTFPQGVFAEADPNLLGHPWLGDDDDVVGDDDDDSADTGDDDDSADTGDDDDSADTGDDDDSADTGDDDDSADTGDDDDSADTGDDDDSALGDDDDSAVSVECVWDLDGDGYGDDSVTPFNAANGIFCDPLLGEIDWTAVGDCNDFDALVNPGATEACDAVDADCDGTAGENQLDGDGDGSLCSDDCDDTDPIVFPGAPDPANDCNTDTDGDGNADAVDNCPGIASTLEGDTDGDGILDCDEAEAPAEGDNSINDSGVTAALSDPTSSTSEATSAAGADTSDERLVTASVTATAGGVTMNHVSGLATTQQATGSTTASFAVETLATFAGDNTVDADGDGVGDAAPEVAAPFGAMGAPVAIEAFANDPAATADIAVEPVSAGVAANVYECDNTNASVPLSGSNARGGQLRADVTSDMMADGVVNGDVDSDPATTTSTLWGNDNCTLIGTATNGSPVTVSGIVGNDLDGDGTADEAATAVVVETRLTP